MKRVQSSLSISRVLLQLANDYLLLLVRSRGTVSRRTLNQHPHRHYRRKHVYFGSRIRTLFYSSFAVILAMVALGVIFLRPFYKQTS